MDTSMDIPQSSGRIGLTEAAKLLQRLKLCKAFNDRGGINGPNCQRFGLQDSATKRWSWDVATLFDEARRRETVSEDEVRIIVHELAEKKASPAPLPDSIRTWCWEGRIQDRIVEYLRSRGFEITGTANTHVRESGKDIQAKSSDGAILWISVKGYPEKSSYTQARHWFAELLFDLILYRAESADAQLGIGLPYGFTTYRNLAARIDWFKQSLPFQFYWVHEDGTVTTE
jgi:hypothetical protein